MRSPPATTGRASSRRRVSSSKFRSQSALDSNTGGRPAVLLGLHELMVPVGALDEPHHERRRPVARRANARISSSCSPESRR